MHLAGGMTFVLIFNALGRLKGHVHLLSGFCDLLLNVLNERERFVYARSVGGAILVAEQTQRAIR